MRSLHFLTCTRISTPAHDANGNLYVGSDGGIFMSSNEGQTWSDKYNIGIASHLLYSVGSSEAAPNAIIGGLQDNGTRVRSGSTSTFNQTLGGDGFGAHVHALNGSQMLGSLYYARIYESTDGGANFVSASSGILESNNSASAPFTTRIVPWLGDSTGNTVFTHVNLKVYKSANYAGSWSALGTSWKQTTDPTNNGLSMSSLSFDTANPNTVYLASVAPDPSKAHLWKSTDFGASWTVLDSGAGFPTGVPVNTIVNDPNDTATLYAGTHLGVYKSSDSGATWSRFGAGMPLVNVTGFYISPASNRMRAATLAAASGNAPLTRRTNQRRGRHTVVLFCCTARLGAPCQNLFLVVPTPVATSPAGRARDGFTNVGGFRFLARPRSQGAWLQLGSRTVL